MVGFILIVFGTIITFIMAGGHPQSLIQITLIMTMIAAPLGSSILAFGIKDVLEALATFRFFFYSPSNKLAHARSIVVLRYFMISTYAIGWVAFILGFIICVGSVGPSSFESFGHHFAAATIALIYPVLFSEVMLRPLKCRLECLACMTVEESTDAAVPSTGIRNGLWAVAIVVLLGGTAFVGQCWWKSASAKGMKPAQPAVAKVDTNNELHGNKIAMPLKKILVNYHDANNFHYLLASLTLIGTGEEFRNAITKQQDQLVDLVSASFAKKSFDELLNSDVRTLAKTELLSTINDALGMKLVENMYFTEFVIQ